MAPFDRLYDLLFVCNCKYSSVLYHFWDKARYWSKIAIFHIPPAFDVSVREERASEYCHKVWYKKTRMVRLPDGKKSHGTFTHFNRIHECNRHQTDGHTDTERQRRPRLCIASRGRNTNGGLNKIVFVHVLTRTTIRLSYIMPLRFYWQYAFCFGGSWISNTLFTSMRLNV